MVVHRIPTVPGHGESGVPELEGIRDAPHAPQVPTSPSPQEAVAVVYRGAVAGGNLAAALAGLLTEAALQAEGRCQRLRQPHVPHLGTAFSFFFFPPAVFALLFAVICSGKPCVPWPRDPHGAI